jgi:membrane protease YdiL (CAAX protease family)
MVAPAWALVLCAGVIFGLLHLPQGAWGMTGAALAGVLFGALFLASGSLLLPLAAHYVVNVVQLGFAKRGTLPEAS